MEDDGFVLVNKEGVADGDDAVSVSSERSSLCVVEDPARDLVLLSGEESENEAPEPASAEPDSSPSEPESSDVDIAVKADTNKPVVEDDQAVPREQPKYVCSACCVDVGATADIIWEGYMGANVPAYLFRDAKNIEPAADPRQQQLSTGQFLVQDVRCRKCSAAFGWRYIKAWSQEQKYKEGTTIIQRSAVQRVN